MCLMLPQQTNWKRGKLIDKRDLYLLCVCMLRNSVVSGSLRPHGLQFHAHLSMEFSKQEYWSGFPFLLQGIFPT